MTEKIVGLQALGNPSNPDFGRDPEVSDMVSTISVALCA
jgi:hypothetical protein